MFWLFFFKQSTAYGWRISDWGSDVCSSDLVFVLPFLARAQEYKAGKANWQNLDAKEDGILGISTEKAYKELVKKDKGVPVIVAVIDGGVQADHQDLRSEGLSVR